MNRYSIRPNVFLQEQDVYLSRPRALSPLYSSARLGEDLAAALTVAGQAAQAVAEAWTRAARRRHTVQQLKPMDPRLLADVGIDYPNLRDAVDQLLADRAEPQAPTPQQAGLRPVSAEA